MTSADGDAEVFIEIDPDGSRFLHLLSVVNKSSRWCPSSVSRKPARHRSFSPVTPTVESLMTDLAVWLPPASVPRQNISSPVGS